MSSWSPWKSMGNDHSAEAKQKAKGFAADNVSGPGGAAPAAQPAAGHLPSAAASSAPAPEVDMVKRPRGCPMQVDVLRINVLQILDIDHVAQKFWGSLFCHFRFINGTHDADLMRDLDDDRARFPKDTLRPGARWFMDQISFPTAHELKVSDSKVVVMEPHVDLVVKISGTFFEIMELEFFPVDTQELTIVLSVSVANEGICPVRFANLACDGGHMVATVNPASFSMSNMWDLSPVAQVAHQAIRPMDHTTYPALSITSMVARKQGYYIFNVILPLGALQLLAVLQFLLPGEFIRVADRIAFSVTLLLTSAAYKLYLSNSLPDISYLTLIDRYVLCNFLGQAGMIVPSLFMGFLRRGDGLASACRKGRPCELGQLPASSDQNRSIVFTLDLYMDEATGEAIDMSLMVFFFLCFVALHGWIGSRYGALRRLKRSVLERHARAAVALKGNDPASVERSAQERAENYRRSVTSTNERPPLRRTFTSHFAGAAPKAFGQNAKHATTEHPSACTA